jgi:hypothetical protein
VGEQGQGDCAKSRGTGDLSSGKQAYWAMGTRLIWPGEQRLGKGSRDWARGAGGAGTGHAW